MIERNVFIALGSNLGEKKANIHKAVELISELDDVEVTGRSCVYRTKPEGGPDQDEYLNMALRIETPISPGDLLSRLKGLEKSMGRVDRPRNHPRIIDMDLIFYGEAVENSDSISIPHPRAHERIFVLEPLSDISPEFVHPVMKKSVEELLQEKKRVSVWKE